MDPARRGPRFAGALLAALVARPVLAERVLVEGPEVSVAAAEGLVCGAPVEVTVYSARPALFERDSPELQRMVDAARAVLAFECADLPELRLLGRLRGLPEPVFRGLASRGSGWSVRAEQTIRSDVAEPAPGVAPSGAGMPSPSAGDGLVLAGLRIGMSPEAARAAIARSFGVEPRYDAERGRMTMHAQGCPAGYDWERRAPAPAPGWKCLNAWFTGDRAPRLYRVELLQVVEAGQREQVERTLVDRFGPPAERRPGEPASWWRGRTGEGPLYLGWGPAVATPGRAAGGEPLHALRATVEPGPSAVLTTVTLEQPEPAPATATGRPDLTL